MSRGVERRILVGSGTFKIAKIGDKILAIFRSKKGGLGGEPGIVRRRRRH